MSQAKCLHCSKTEDEVPSMLKMTSGDHVCGDCVVAMNAFLKESSAPGPLTGGTRTPKEIVAFLNDYVIGQDDAKITLAIAVYNHYKRLGHVGDLEITKSNVLMLGPTGTGKTLLAASIARLLDVPFAVADATSLTQAGYVGDDVEGIILRLLQAAGDDIAKAQRGIVFLDEVDKIATSQTGPSVSRDVSGEGVQQALLKLIEGTKVNVATAGRKMAGVSTVTVDTTNILFICAGAFVSLLNKLDKGGKKANSIGFASRATETKQDKEVTPELLIEFGMIPEFVGRMPVITTLTALDQGSLERILVEPKNAVVRQMRALFDMEGAELIFEDGAIAEIAKQAHALKTGARGARGVLEKLLKAAQYEVPGTEGAVVTVTKSLEVSVSYPNAIAALKAA